MLTTCFSDSEAVAATHRETNTEQSYESPQTELIYCLISMEEWDRCDLVEPCPQNRQPPPYRLVEKTPDGRSYRVAMRKTWVTHLRLHGITVNPETTMNVLPAAPTKPNILTAERTERLALKDDSLSSSFYGEDEAMNLPPPCLTTNHQQDRGNEKGLLLIQTGSEREGKRRSVGLR